MSNSHKLVVQADAHPPAVHVSTHAAAGSDPITGAIAPTTIELGHASDTTLARVSAGVVSIEGTNIVKAGAATGSGLTMATAKLLGRSTASTGAIEEITVGTNLTLSAGTLSASGSSGVAAADTGILAAMVYSSGSDVDMATTTSASLGDADATNAKITFTAPASGKVVVEAEFACSNGTSRIVYAGLRESTTNVGEKTLCHNLTAADNVRVRVSWYLTGLSAGSHTYKFAIATSAGTAHFPIGPTYGSFRMTVFAAP